MMKKAYVATKSRGFLVNLFNSNIKNVEFIYKKDKLYETNSKIKKYISKMVKSRFSDHVGIIRRLDIPDENFDLAFSYNRFLKSSKKYIIYLENPLALMHYSTGRNKTYLGKAKLNKYLKDPNLVSIICLSKACFDTLNNFYSIPERIIIEQIYPLIPNNRNINPAKITSKCHKKEIQCLYISSNFNLKGGKDIIETFKRLKIQGIDNIKLKIVTQIESVHSSSLKEINNNNNIELYKFNFNKEELNEIYSSSNILLNPTRQDSFSLVVLEAMKNGNTIITTDLYAIPEMVKSNINGYLTEPRFRFFNYNNMPNLEVWNNRKNTIYSDYTDFEIVDFIYEKLLSLNHNRAELERLSLNSYKEANTGAFDEESIKNKWSSIINGI
ncbi:glycosyltransferase [Alkalihalobacillus macyae]|uniref:glycosyltransferase n=1 Tax=Guptibacillus hwajinpoensis TaxID=208199 RepID=UPI00273CC88D|nr:glycosyltransferase [Alkalihalobacillus macyae]MDP4551664.1 glycosyltransferase [Alkalihalobacillus macyae]